jgi:hypothetical protein
MVGREHAAEARADDVEARVRVGKPLRVADVEADREPLLLGPAAGGVDQAGREVEAGHFGARARRRAGQLARPGGDVEPALARPGREPGEQVVVGDPEVVADPLVGGRAPHHRLLRLQLLERHQ